MKRLRASRPMADRLPTCATSPGGGRSTCSRCQAARRCACPPTAAPGRRGPPTARRFTTALGRTALPSCASSSTGFRNWHPALPPPRLGCRAWGPSFDPVDPLSDFVRIDSLADPRVDAYRLIGDQGELVDRQLFVAEGRLVVRRLLDLRQWPIESILLSAAAAENL